MTQQRTAGKTPQEKAASKQVSFISRHEWTLVGLLAVLTLLLPSGLMVAGLNARMPEEGGFYLWTRTAVGDVHGDIKLITVAWAEGIQAAIYAFKEITSPYWLNEKRLKDYKIALIGEKISSAARSAAVRMPPLAVTSAAMRVAMSPR